MVMDLKIVVLLGLMALIMIASHFGSSAKAAQKREAGREA
jgi:hypothetical protein